MRRTSFGRMGIALLASTLAATALGHHSTAEFDYTKQLTIEGTVKEVQWTNPHSFIQLIVEDKGKEPVEWSVEIGSPAINTALGWKKTSVKRGDKVSMLLSPARNGTPYGTLRKLTFEDGRELIGVAGRARPPAPAPAAPAKGQ
jgi:ABC-type glycerol-3-phosphate transport system substrate-binding protein